ncbi:histidinol-phosphate transaminase [Lachnospiraceae bacterium 46-15]
MTKLHIHGGDVYRYPYAIDFSSNCNPYGTPEGVKRAVAEAAEFICHYPDVQCQKLREALAEEEGIPASEIICGNGAADLIFGLALARKPRRALLLAPTFAEYAQALRAVGCEIAYCYLKEEQGFAPQESLLGEITEDVDIVFFCNPNNPTGVLTEVDFLRKLADKCRESHALFVVDECFVDFVREPGQYTMKPWLGAYDNLFVLKAFTKKYAMPGIRLGYGLCSNGELLAQMRAVMQPWNVSAAAQAAGIAALKEREYVRITMEKIAGEREYLLEKLKETGVSVCGSSANYIFFKAKKGLWKDCMDRGISIRDCGNYEGLGEGFYRIAVRTRGENDKLLKTLREIIE